MKYFTTVNGRTFTIEIDGENTIIVDGERHTFDFMELGRHALHSLLLDNRSIEALIERQQNEYHIVWHGSLYTTQVEDERTLRLATSATKFEVGAGEIHITAPMPGLIVEVAVQKGDSVHEGDNIVILESMKMQNELKAPRAGVISRVSVKAGDSVQQSQLLVTIK